MKKFMSVLVVTMLMLALVAVPSAFAATVTVTDDATLRAAVLVAGDTVVLANDIALVKKLVLNAAGVTLDGAGFTLSADATFPAFNPLDKAVSHLVETLAPATLKNVEIVTGPKNRHALNVYLSGAVTLDGLTLDHRVANSGAPLVINNSDVTVKNGLTIKTGANSWYGINVDNFYGDTSLVFEDCKVNHIGDNPVVIYPEKKDPTKELEIDTGTTGLELDDLGFYILTAYSVELNCATHTMMEGDTATLVATIDPPCVVSALTWSSSDMSVATVDANGVVTALKPGTVTITVATENDKTDTCVITVTAKAAPVVPVTPVAEGKTPVKVVKSPATGDASNTVALVVAGLIGLVAVGAFSKKKVTSN